MAGMRGAESELLESAAWHYQGLVLLGPTGSGKTPLGQILAQRGIWGRNCVHLDFGALLRHIAGQAPWQPPYQPAKSSGADSSKGSYLCWASEQIHPSSSQKATSIWAHYFTSSEREFIQQVLRRGALLEDEHFPLAVKILNYFLVLEGLQGPELLAQTEEFHPGEDHLALPGLQGPKFLRQTEGRAGPNRSEPGGGPLIVLNGLPRHVGQAEALKSWLKVQAVVHLDCPAEVVLERIGSNVGGDRQGRTDDDLQSIEAKLAIYRTRTQPLIHYYQSRGVPIVRLEVTAEMTPLQAWQQLQGQNPWKTESLFPATLQKPEKLGG